MDYGTFEHDIRYSLNIAKNVYDQQNFQHTFDHLNSKRSKKR
ncbi:hypothetical protein C8D85_1053 [Marinomonas communis]|jgi:hypothetical protein|uniref:Uncharacterized protein n=1 Tax=Marinomonas communis TaxID=28254 RepID=A0A4R6XC24_9GAMM|nr:hypothetical protein C8D85_1053 [Marinomonas communis]